MLRDHNNNNNNDYNDDIQYKYTLRCVFHLFRIFMID